MAGGAGARLGGVGARGGVVVGGRVDPEGQARIQVLQARVLPRLWRALRCHQRTHRARHAPREFLRSRQLNINCLAVCMCSFMCGWRKSYASLERRRQLNAAKILWSRTATLLKRPLEMGSVMLQAACVAALNLHMQWMTWLLTTQCDSKPVCFTITSISIIVMGRHRAHCMWDNTAQRGPA